MQKSDIQKLSNALLNYETAFREEEQRRREEEQRKREEEIRLQLERKQFLLQFPRNAAIFCLILGMFLAIVSKGSNNSAPVFVALSLVLLSFYFLYKGWIFYANLFFIFTSAVFFMEIKEAEMWPYSIGPYSENGFVAAVGVVLASVISILVHIPMVGNKYDKVMRVLSWIDIFISGFFFLVAFAGLFGK